MSEDPLVTPEPPCRPDRQCTARSKRTGERCRRPAMEGRTVCYHHGGKTPRGPALPQFKTGRYSKLLPSQLASSYRRAARDPNLLELRQDVALVDARIAQLVEGLSGGESGETWKRLGHAWNTMVRSQAAREDLPALKQYLVEIGNLVARGAEGASAESAIWGDVTDLLHLRRRLVDSERKRLVDLQQMVDKQQLLVFVGLLFEVVSKHVADRATLASIIADVGRLTGAGGGDLPADSQAEAGD